jgi:hypothetical protein
VAFASDLDGVAAVEGIARAYAAATNAIYPRRKPVTRVVWRFAPPDGGSEWWFNGTAPYTGDVIVNFCWDDMPEVPSLSPDLESRVTEQALFHLQYVLAYDAHWKRAAAEGKTISEQASTKLTGKRLSELDNPFHHLVEILARGYAYSDIDSKALYLIAPL